MGKLVLLAVFILSGLAGQAQKVIISGKIAKSEADSVLVAISPNPLSAQEAQSTSAIDAQGQFSIEVPVTKATTADFVYESDAFSFFLQPGDQLEVKFNGDDFFNTLKFKGKGANENNFLVAYEKKFEENEDYQILPENIRLKEPDFRKFLDYRKADQLKFFRNYANKTPVSEAFTSYMLAQIEYSWANDLLTFADLRARVLGGTALKLSTDYYTFLDKVELNNPAAVNSHAYTGFLENYLHYLAANTNHQKTDVDYYQVFYNLAKEKLKGEPRNLVLAHILFESMKKGFIQYTNSMFKDFESLNTNKDLNDFLAVQYNVRKAFAIGSPAPDFKLKSLNGKEFSLNDFKGKLIYLNFWDSRCGLCQMDLPYAQELEKELSGKNVVFINIGVDNDEELWRYSVGKRKLMGVQLYAANREDILRKYKVVDVPSYYLIDTDGAFISTKAKRPSNAGAQADIVQALRK